MTIPSYIYFLAFALCISGWAAFRVYDHLPKSCRRTWWDRYAIWMAIWIATFYAGYKPQPPHPQPEHPSEAYVQDGLVLQLDGIDNSGVGVHDPTARSWVDLSGNGFDATGGEIEWRGGNTAALVDTTIQSQLPSDLAALYNDNKVTTEVIYRNAASGNVIPFEVRDGAYAVVTRPLSYYGRSLFSVQYRGGQAKIKYGTQGEVLSYSMSGKSLYVDGSNRPDVEFMGTWTYDVSLGMKLSLSGRNGDNEFFAVRIYNRALSPEEIAWNYAVDQWRFFGGPCPFPPEPAPKEFWRIYAKPQYRPSVTNDAWSIKPAADLSVMDVTK